MCELDASLDSGGFGSMWLSDDEAADRLAEALDRMEKANVPRDVALYYHIEGL